MWSFTGTLFVLRSSFAVQTTIAPWWALRPTWQVWPLSNHLLWCLVLFLLTSNVLIIAIIFCRALPPQWSAGLHTGLELAANTCTHGAAKWREGMFIFVSSSIKCIQWTLSELFVSFFQLLSFPLGDCPRYKQLMNQTEHSPEFLNVTKTYQVQVLSLVNYMYSATEVIFPSNSGITGNYVAIKQG